MPCLPLSWYFSEIMSSRTHTRACVVPHTAPSAYIHTCFYRTMLCSMRPIRFSDLVKEVAYFFDVFLWNNLITRTRTQLPATLALPLAFLEVKREIVMQTQAKVMSMRRPTRARHCLVRTLASRIMAEKKTKTATKRSSQVRYSRHLSLLFLSFSLSLSLSLSLSAYLCSTWVRIVCLTSQCSRHVVWGSEF